MPKKSIKLVQSAIYYSLARLGNLPHIIIIIIGGTEKLLYY